MAKGPSDKDILYLAARKHVTAEELDLLVSGSHRTTRILENDVNKLRNKLDAIEEQLDKL